MNLDIQRAAERTRLSWRRTTLSATTVVLVAAIRLALVRLGHPVGVASPARPALAGVAAALIAVAWVGLLAVAGRRVRQLDRGTSGPLRRTPGVLALLVAGCALLGILVIG